MTNTKVRAGHPPVILHLQPVLQMDEEQFFEFCQLNAEWRIERSSEGNLEIMPPTGGETGKRNFILNHLFAEWMLQDGTGAAFDSSTGFVLPNGAMHSPDAAWIQRGRLAELTAEQRQKFLPLCPDFVIELRSPSDQLSILQNKMEEYVENGVRLSWLLDVSNRRVYVYRPEKDAELVDTAFEISRTPELPGFVLDLRRIWQSDF